MSAPGPYRLAGAPDDGDRTSWRLATPALAALLCTLALVLNWRGSDLPAQLFRADLIRRHGFVLWNNLWYGGHPTIDYGLLTPVLGAITGPRLLAAASCVVAAEVFGRILRDAFVDAWRLGSLVFAAAAAVNVIVGRVPFALGLALGLLAVRMLQRDRFRAAALFGLAASTASPVAGAFLALIAVAWGLSRHERRYLGAVVAAVTAAPVVLGTLLYPEGGHFPLRWSALAWDLAVTALVAFLAWRDGRRTLVTGSALYGLACVGAFVVSSPLGGNVSRLGQFAAAPLVIALLLPRRRPVLGRGQLLVMAALVLPLVVWQWTPAVDTAVAAGKDPSTQRAYFQPVVDQIVALSGSTVRTEIPFTFRHWETTYVADTIPLARGWERQVDIAQNPSFYEDALTPEGYHAWLMDNAVGFVALPDARLDRSSLRERELLTAGVPGLQEVWSDAHWRLWRVTGYRGLVDGPALVTKLGATDIHLQVTEPGNLLVRLHYSGHWQVDGAGCVRRSDAGWTEVMAVKPGPLVISQALLGSTCTSP